MHVLGHYDITGDNEEVAEPHALQRIFEEIHGCGRREIGSATITAEGEEVKFRCLLITDSLAFHPC